MCPLVMFSLLTTFHFLVRLSVQYDLILSQGHSTTNIHIPVCLRSHSLAVLLGHGDAMLYLAYLVLCFG